MGRTFSLYVLGSAVLSVGVVLNAYHSHHQFYNIVVSVAKSKAAVLVLGNLGFIFTFLLGQLIQKIFLGELREIEIENLNDKLITTITDTLFVMTIFRDEFNYRFVILFTGLLFMKIFHWLSHDRVEYLEQAPPMSRMTYFRLLSLMIILLTLDISSVYYACSYSLKNGPSMMLLFGFEYALLTLSVVLAQMKYFFHLYDLRTQGRWESKASWILYLDFFTDVLKLLVYIVFFGVILNYYGLPLHIIRQVYLTFRSFQRKIVDVLRYRQVTANMNERFPDATAEELGNTDATCIVCREEMNSGKKLPCGHILHFHCLRSWLHRRQTCPTCRASVLYEDHPNLVRQQQQQQQPQQNNAPNNENNFNYPIPPHHPLHHLPPQYFWRPMAQPPPQQNLPQNETGEPTPTSSTTSSTTSSSSTAPTTDLPSSPYPTMTPYPYFPPQVPTSYPPTFDPNSPSPSLQFDAVQSLQALQNDMIDLQERLLSMQERWFVLNQYFQFQQQSQPSQPSQLSQPSPTTTSSSSISSSFDYLSDNQQFKDEDEELKEDKYSIPTTTTTTTSTTTTTTTSNSQTSSRTHVKTEDEENDEMSKLRRRRLAHYSQ